jgi:hypothetical protein
MIDSGLSVVPPQNLEAIPRVLPWWDWDEFHGGAPIAPKPRVGVSGFVFSRFRIMPHLKILYDLEGVS